MEQRKKSKSSLLSILIAFIMVVGIFSNLPGMTMQVYAENGGTTDKEELNTAIDDAHKLKITNTDAVGNIIEGARFNLCRTDGRTLSNVSVVGANDKAKDRVKAFVDDNNDIEENNDKSVEITLSGVQSFTLSGTTLNQVTVNDVLINESSEQNVYTYSGRGEDKLVIRGMYDGIYIVTLDDGTEYIISCDKDSKDITQIDVRVMPKVSNDVADLKDNSAIISEDKRNILFTGGAVDISGLGDGEYVLEEEESPNGFTKGNNVYVFAVENGNVILSGENEYAVVENGNEITVMDDVSEIDFYKFYDTEENMTPDGANGGEEMKLTFKKASNKVANVIKDVDTLEVGESVTWNTNDDNPKTLRGLMDGEYYFEEIDGLAIYDKAEARTVIIENGAVLLKDGGKTIGSRPYTHLLSQMKDHIVIDKMALGAEEIPKEAGKAEFTLNVKTDGIDLTGVVIGKGDDVIKVEDGATSVKFEGNSTNIFDLKNGKYSLVENTAPLGYCAVDEFEFEVEDGLVKKVQSVGYGKTSVSADGKTLTVEDCCYAISAGVSANNRFYDGTEKPLVNITGEATNGIMNYVIGEDDQNVPSEGWSTSIPVATEVGTYYVWYKAVGIDNKMDSVPEIIVVDIEECSHTKVEIRNAKNPTCTEKGYEGDKYCTSCNTMLEKGKDIEALGHKYGEPQYVWSEDGKSCVATAICSNDTTHKLTEEAVITSKVKKPSTTTEKGITTYTATFKNDIFKPQTKDVDDIAVKKNSDNGKYSSEWINGKWYGADGSQTYEATLSWKSNATGWWVEDSAGWYPQDKWQKIDGIWYFFKSDGYMTSNEYYNGYWFNKDGSWDSQYFLSWKSNATGWWVEDLSGWWPSSQWLKIDGSWYFFDSSGYMVTNQYVEGYWIGADGICQ